MWEQFEILGEGRDARRFRQGPSARVRSTATDPQLALQQFRIASPEEIDIADYLPHTPYDVEELYKRLLGYVER